MVYLKIKNNIKVRENKTLLKTSSNNHLDNDKLSVKERKIESSSSSDSNAKSSCKKASKSFGSISSTGESFEEDFIVEMYSASANGKKKGKKYFFSLNSSSFYDEKWQLFKNGKEQRCSSPTMIGECSLFFLNDACSALTRHEDYE